MLPDPSHTLPRQKWINIIIIIALSLIWGSSFILIKQGLKVFSAPQVACLRLSFSGLVMLPAAYFNFKHISIHRLAYILLFGILNAGIPPFLFARAQQGLPSSVAGVLNALTPVFTLLTGALFSVWDLILENLLALFWD